MVNLQTYFAKNRLTQAYRFIFGLALLLMSVSSWSATDIKVTLDRNPIAISDTFTLVFSSSKAPDGAPDFSPLKTDFEIINQQESTQTALINGSMTKSIEWHLTLMAKRLGTLTIPSIAFGDDTTAQTSITVNQSNDHNADNNSPLFLDVSVSKEQAYVQSQIIYTVRVFQRVNLSQASLSEPKADDLITIQLGESSSYNTLIQGVNYRVTEIKYALFPQKSGPLRIEPLVLNAQQLIDDPRDRFNSFFSMQQTQTKRLTSDAITIDVLPAPDTFQGSHWLPAQEVGISQSWTNDTLTINAGEPITRTITLVARGATASQLPDVGEGEHIDNIKMYPDKVETHDQKETDGITSLRQQKIAIIASAPGQYTLPAIDIPWFNTKTNRIEHASLPAATITVNGTAMNTPSKPTNTVSQQTPSSTIELSTPELEQKANSSNSDLWIWLTALFASLWLLTLYWLWRSRHQKPPVVSSKSETSETSSHDILKTLKQAAQQNDAKLALETITQWRQQNPNIEDSVTHILADINRSLYAPDSGEWNGQHLVKLLEDGYFKTGKPKAEQSQSALEPLNRI